MSEIRERASPTRAPISCFRRTANLSAKISRKWRAGRSSRQAVRLRPSGHAGQALLAFASEAWWSRSGSNRRPQACKARALPTELRPREQILAGVPGVARGNRPGFALWAMPGRLLSLSRAKLVGPGRVERPTSRLSGVRSNHLSYEPGPVQDTRFLLFSFLDGRKGNEDGVTA